MPSRHVIVLFYSFFISSMEKHKLLLRAVRSSFSLERSKGKVHKESAHKRALSETIRFFQPFSLR